MTDALNRKNYCAVANRTAHRQAARAIEEAGDSIWPEILPVLRLRTLNPAAYGLCIDFAYEVALEQRASLGNKRNSRRTLAGVSRGDLRKR